MRGETEGLILLESSYSVIEQDTTPINPQKTRMDFLNNKILKSWWYWMPLLLEWEKKQIFLVYVW